MSRIRSVLASCALSLCAGLAHAQSATPVVSNLIAFNVSNPTGNLSLGADGAIYGVTSPGTSVAGGLIYRAAIDGSSIRTVFQIDPAQGLQPLAGLTLGSDGLFYGTTRFGSINETSTTGTVFRISPSGTDFTVIHRFATATGTSVDVNAINTDGAYPEAELIEGSDGYLYGVTTAGGPNGSGTVFKVLRDGTGFVVLHSFEANRCPAISNVAKVFLYQRTATGVVPTVDQTGSATYTFSTHALTGQPAGWATAMPDQGSGESLWVIQATAASSVSTDTINNVEWSTPVVTTADGAPGMPGHTAALICAYKRAGAQPTDNPGQVVYTFETGAWAPGNGWSAAIPEGTDQLWVTAAIAASATASDEIPGAEWSGAVSGGAATRTINRDGAAPRGRIVQATSGDLYGTTSAGGEEGRGTVFRLAADGSGFNVLHTFSDTIVDTTTGLPENADGAIPLAGLTDGGDGFYGVTSVGGTAGGGVVFRIAPDGGTPAVLHHFDGTTGARPTVELLLGTDGKLYGTTDAGGVTSSNAASTFGTIFSIDRAGTNFARLHSFDGSAGATPSSSLVQLGDADFIGATTSSGRCGYGALYRYRGDGTAIEGDDRCGRRRNDSGGGHGGPILVLLLGSLAWLRRKVT